VDEILGESNINDAYQKQCETMHSKLLINNGSGSFEARDLPAVAQWAPIQDIVVHDFNNDGKDDLFLAGNLIDTEPETPSYDGGKGIVLLSQGNGEFETIYDRKRIGISFDQNLRALEKVQLGNNRLGIIGANNNGILQLTRIKK